MSVADRRGRVLRDLRISVTDRCNFRCRYCMPVEVFGADYQYLPHAEILTFEEIARFARIAVDSGVTKLRLTGGEPLLRRDLHKLVASLAEIEGVEDLAMTTNGVLLPKYVDELKAAGLQRVTVSLDAIDEDIFAQMNGVGAKVAKVVAGIEAALAAGLGAKVNAVIRKGSNEQEIVPLAEKCREWGVPLRFIEFMDVGSENSWRMEEVYSAKEILADVEAVFPLEPLSDVGTSTARRWKYQDGRGEIGIIASVTMPFCAGCGRIRLSADGRLYTCLFATAGRDVKSVLRSGAPDKEVAAALGTQWQARNDNYSEVRGSGTVVDTDRVSMSYIGG